VLLTDQDIYLFREGTHVRAYEKLGAHPAASPQAGGEQGTHFSVWAPNAASVSVVGDFNGWSPTAHRLQPRADSSGIWEAFVRGVRPGALYKYHIVSRHAGYTVDKSDPQESHREFMVLEDSWRFSEYLHETRVLACGVQEDESAQEDRIHVRIVTVSVTLFSLRLA